MAKKVYRYEINEVINGYGGQTIENPGPYRARCGGDDVFGDEKKEKYFELYNDMCNKHGGNSHPTRSEDKLGYDDDVFCACATLEDLKKWFKGYNKKLIAVGFNLVEYRVKTFKMGESGKQVGFKREHVIGKKILT